MTYTPLSYFLNLPLVEFYAIAKDLDPVS